MKIKEKKGLFIGDINHFAIEYRIRSGSSNVMGNMRLWVQGKYIGAFQDENIIGVTLCDLEKLNPRLHTYENSVLVDLSTDEVFKRVLEDDDADEYGQYYFTPGEAFDDFAIIIFSDNDSLYFVWKLEDDPYFEYPDYPKQIQSGKVSINECWKVITQFKDIVSLQK